MLFECIIRDFPVSAHFPAARILVGESPIDQSFSSVKNVNLLRVLLSVSFPAVGFTHVSSILLFVKKASVCLSLNLYERDYVHATVNDSIAFR